MMEAVKQCRMTTHTEAEIFEKEDALISEEPIQFVYNGIAHMVMMCTPMDLEDLAYGFSLTEGIIHDGTQILGVEVVTTTHGIELRIEIEPVLMSRLEGTKRQMSARTGCGVCGVENLSLVEKTLSPLEKAEPIDFSLIQTLLKKSDACQYYGQMTGASHAAFLCDRAGNILLTREDVGRHVALDKLIGALMNSAFNPQDVIILMSSRASFEIVQKTIAARVRTLITMSAPTDKAVWMAQKYHLSLWSFARKGRVNHYAT
ncbi:formate dehydrogenase accessory sulfurtransferase FdhD [Wohlfahrtiimonas chitiniclastica]|uniref:formate dehydrogenase accessory sulfurtransferase FdhD n=1 Tax=Wohlfahrtiimonas chitiniclastica TaxID=400946 RepID=UPI000A719299|nr:formate dehydrogenase accessory sulfurtransferase FdhD [Wohlfahrtiimonas chitiniclastica]WHR56096.1 formate dehydrogenase accessory sulfurtransferase FdhD [Wohlfahrtiimonas chitiniclastica]